MTDRYTRKDAQRVFERLCAALGKRIAHSYNDVGAYQLDYNSIYGGYVVEEILSDSGVVCRPFGDNGQPAREFCERVNFALRVMAETEESK